MSCQKKDGYGMTTTKTLRYVFSWRVSYHIITELTWLLYLILTSCSFFSFSQNSIARLAQYVGHLSSNTRRAISNGTTVVSWDEYRNNRGELGNGKSQFKEKRLETWLLYLMLTILLLVWHRLHNIICKGCRSTIYLHIYKTIVGVISI